MFDTPVKLCIAIVVDPQHERFGQQGEVVAHDWRESGKVHIRFSDNIEEFLDDGMMSDDLTLPQVRLFEKTDQRIPIFERRLQEKKGELAFTANVLQDSSYSTEGREIAKRTFYKLLSGEA